MTTAWCPSCRSEYVEGMSECPDCGVALVAELPEKPRRGRDRESRGEPRPMDPDDDLVEVATVPALEAELIAGRLRESGVDAVVFGTGLTGYLGGGVSTEGSRVMVRRADAERAATLL